MLSTRRFTGVIGVLALFLVLALSGAADAQSWWRRADCLKLDKPSQFAIRYRIIWALRRFAATSIS